MCEREFSTLSLWACACMCECVWKQRHYRRWLDGNYEIDKHTETVSLYYLCMYVCENSKWGLQHHYIVVHTALVQSSVVEILKEPEMVCENDRGMRECENVLMRRIDFVLLVLFSLLPLLVLLLLNCVLFFFFFFVCFGKSKEIEFQAMLAKVFFNKFLNEWEQMNTSVCNNVCYSISLYMP